MIFRVSNRNLRSCSEARKRQFSTTAIIVNGKWLFGVHYAIVLKPVATFLNQLQEKKAVANTNRFLSLN